MAGDSHGVPSGLFQGANRLRNPRAHITLHMGRRPTEPHPLGDDGRDTRLDEVDLRASPGSVARHHRRLRVDQLQQEHRAPWRHTAIMRMRYVPVLLLLRTARTKPYGPVSRRTAE